MFSTGGGSDGDGIFAKRSCYCAQVTFGPSKADRQIAQPSIAVRLLPGISLGVGPRLGYLSMALLRKRILESDDVLPLFLTPTVAFSHMLMVVSE
jgi:hypothetical protein